VRLAKSFCEDVEFSPEDATRSDASFLCEVLEAVIEAGATTVNIPDTVGYAVPEEYSDLIRTLRQRVRGIAQVTISTHCHNDLGLAVANSLAAVSAGARQVECTINGIGERAGNASLEEFVMAMRVRPDRCPYNTSVVSEQLFPASQLLTEITGVPVQPNKAIIGRNAFAHEAGIHQDGMIKNALTYEIMTPQSVGVPSTRLVLGKHSGRDAVRLRFEQLGFQLDRHELDHVYGRFLALADRVKVVDDYRIFDLVRQARIVVSANEDGAQQPSTEAGSTAEIHPTSPTHTSNRPDPLLASTLLATRNEGEQQEDYLWGV